MFDRALSHGVGVNRGSEKIGSTGVPANPAPFGLA